MSETKHILITGATSGIGFETARYLHENGYRLVLTGRNEEALAEISEITDTKHRLALDLEKKDSAAGIFEYCRDHEIMLDGLVHAAGYAINMPVRSLNEEHMERQMRIHYYSFLELCKGFYSKRVSRENASIVALSSIAAMTRKKGSVMYAASKSALNTAVTVTAKEYAKRGIRVNALMPAYVDTRMNDGLENLINIEEEQPFGMIPPKHIAYIIEFLLSEKSRFITGALIPVSGGMEF